MYMPATGINQAFIRPINSNTTVASQGNNSTKPAVSFGDYLKESMDSTEIKFSKHAEGRLASRNINLSKEQKVKLGAAVSKADQKGIKDSLVMMDNIALVVNVKSRTVVTAMSSSEAKENVFTNIDGAILV